MLVDFVADPFTPYETEDGYWLESRQDEFEYLHFTKPSNEAAERRRAELLANAGPHHEAPAEPFVDLENEVVRLREQLAERDLTITELREQLEAPRHRGRPARDK